MRARVHRSAAAAPVLATARRRAFLPLLAAVLLAAACGADGQEPGDTGAAATPAPAPASEAEAAPQPRPASVSPEDSIRMAREDSAELARDYYQRMGARESLASCMAKTRDADPPQRAVLEAACKRSRPTAP